MKKNRNKGFSLIEMIIILGITIIVMATLSTIFVSSWRYYKNQQKFNELQSYNREIIYKIANDIKQADSVIASYSYSGANYVSSENTLILKLPSIDSMQNIISAHFDYYIFCKNPLNPQELSEIIIPDTLSSRIFQNKILSLNLDTLVFSYYDANNSLLTSGFENSYLVKINLILSEIVNAKKVSVDFSSQAKLRNK